MSKKLKRSEIKTGTLHRSFAFSREQINEDERSVELSFSSEAEVERWFGIEVLDHSPEAVRLERLKTLGPLLVDHNTRDQVGVIEDIEITSDRVGRAVVRFGKSARASEIFQDVLDGIRGNVSVRYQIYRMVLEDPSADVEVYRAVDWEPLEVSIVSVPADISVGVGRDFKDDAPATIVESEETEPAAPQRAAAPLKKEIRVMEPKEIEEARKKAVAANQKRSNNIVALAEQHSVPMKEVREFLESDKSIEDFQRHILGLQRAKIVDQENPNELGLDQRDTKNYSLLRAINASLSGNWDEAEFERECSLKIGENLGRDAKGFFVPTDIQRRDLTAAGAATGAEMVGADHLAGSFIDALVADSVLGQLGATFLPGLVGNVDIPAMGAATFYWLTEGEDGTDSTPATRSVILKPKTISGAVPMSRRFVKQSAPSAEMLVERLLRQGAAAAIDQGIIAGTGADGQPLGLFSQVGINTETIVAPGQPTWANLVSMETKVAEDEALKGRLGYLMAHGVVGHCKTTPKVAANAIFMLENGEVNGHKALGSSLVPANGIAFGNFEDVYVGLWGTLDVNPDASTNAASGGLILRVFQDVDGGVGNAVSFCVPA